MYSSLAFTTTNLLMDVVIYVVFWRNDNKGSKCGFSYNPNLCLPLWSNLLKLQGKYHEHLGTSHHPS